MMWHGFGWGGFGFGGGIFMIIFVVLVIGLIIWAVSGGRRGCGMSYAGHSSDSLDIAAERYARGEISKEQFEQLKRDLR